jgi:hypothetical protein
MASRADKPLLLKAILGSKDEVAMMRPFSNDPDLYLDIRVEVENVAEDVKRSHYSVSLSVPGNRVVESTKFKPQSSVVKWEWKAKNEM